MSLSRRSFLRASAAATLVAGIAGGTQRETRPGASNRLTADVAVVGAGLAGLSAARALAAAGVDVAVLEAGTKVGGRALGLRLPDGQQIDPFGHWLADWDPSWTNRFLCSLNVRGASIPATLPVGEPNRPARLAGLAATARPHPAGRDGLHVDVCDGRRTMYEGPLAAAAGSAADGVEGAFAQLAMMAAEIDPDRPWAGVNADTRDALTVADWIEDTVVAPAARRVVSAAVEISFGIPVAQVSLLSALLGIAAVGGVDGLRTAGTAGRVRFDGSLGQVAAQMAATLGDRVQLGTAVRQVTRDSRGVRLEGPGVDVRARRVVVATSSGIQVEGGPPGAPPPLPGPAAVACVYDTPFWRADGLSGLATLDSGPVRATADATPPSGGPAVLVATLTPAAAWVWASRSRPERRDAVTAALGACFGSAARQPVAYVEGDETGAPARGYGPGFPPGSLGVLRALASAEDDAVAWASSRAPGIGHGQAEGAVRAGERAAAA